jgi:hypothetical protein
VGGGKMAEVIRDFTQLYIPKAYISSNIMYDKA